MKVEDLEDISVEELRGLVVYMYKSFDDDAKHYKDPVYKSSHDSLLYKLFMTRMDRIKKRLSIIRKSR